MDHTALLFAIEVRKIVLDRSREQIKGLTPAEAIAHGEANGRAIFEAVIDELEEYAVAIEKYRASKNR
jgi:hypothetical protein